MKKVLFASTALVMTAGVAAADIELKGKAQLGLKYDGATTTVVNDIDIDVIGSAETDGGLALGASIDIDGDSAGNGAASVTAAKDPEVFISYNGLTLTVGDVDSAAGRGGLADVGFDGIGVDDVAEKPGGSNGFGSDDVRIDYAFGDIKVAVSMDSATANNDWAIGASASFDAFSIDVGAGDTGGTDFSRVTLGYSAGAFGAKAHYGKTGAADAWGLEGSYTTGDVTVTAVYADGGASDAYGIGVAYDLGGATLAGGFGEVAGTTKADLGITFSF